MLGRLSTDCETTDCLPFICYEECKHRTDVYEKAEFIPFSSQPFFAAFIDAFISDHERILKEQCEYVPDTEELVLRAGLPAQIQTAYAVGDEIICCELGTCCKEIIPISGDCIKTADIPLIAELIAALKCVHVAGWDGIQGVLSVIGGELLGIANGNYSISLPEESLQYASLINLILPVPAGMGISIYKCEENEVLQCLNAQI